MMRHDPDGALAHRRLWNGLPAAGVASIVAPILQPGRGATDVTTILITGANRGIGLALAAAAVRQGQHVIATARTPKPGDTLSALGAKLECLTLDVTSRESLEALGRTLAGRAIDVLVVNAGMHNSRGGLDDRNNDAASWSALFATNVVGAFQTVRTLLPNVVAVHGKIAFISSRMGSSTRAAGNAYGYRATKAAVSNIAANLAVELKPRGVAVASYHPGWVKTDMGGSGAEITVEESARGLLARIEALSLATSGAFESYDGTTIPF